MRILAVLSASALVLLAGCSYFKPSKVFVGSVAPVQSFAPVQTTALQTAPITQYVDPQRPVDCPRYVIDAEDECY
jgi:hypothetical protein